MRAPSIMQDEKKCLVTGYPYGLDVHHIFGGPNRNFSDHYGFWCFLRHDVHQKLHDHQEPYRTLQIDLRKKCQQRYEEMGHSREQFMTIIGRSYL